MNKKPETSIVQFDRKRKQPISDSQQQFIPISKFKAETNAQFYQASLELENAVNVALLAGKPLLLTGEPGTGKTQLAYRLAWEFQLGDVLKFETKSTSKAVDLFYNFNMIGYYQAAQIGNEDKNAVDFITYNALGKAILLAKEKEDIETVIGEQFKHFGPKRSIVLIDEIDKAPRDFPNDILNELEGMYFKIPELNHFKPIKAPDKLAPIVIITSNSEKNLPNAFLRRCVYHHIEFPDSDEILKEIVFNRIQLKTKESATLNKLIQFFMFLREKDLNKKPATGELIVWLQLIFEERKKGMSGTKVDSNLLERTIGILLKSKEDLDKKNILIDEWLNS